MCKYVIMSIATNKQCAYATVFVIFRVIQFILLGHHNIDNSYHQIDCVIPILALSLFDCVKKY
jgi:hypothetical protein